MVTLDLVPSTVDPSTITWQRVVGVVAVWCVATVLVLVVAAETRIGPVLVTLTRRHGVHLGDAVALVVGYTAAALATWWILRVGRGSPDASTAADR